MSTITVENLAFSYPGSAENVFDGLNLRLDTGWKLGLVGRNGRGKTTLLRLLMGEYEYSGRITAPVPFSFSPPKSRTPRSLRARCCAVSAPMRRTGNSSVS